jgi:hypothetical protein
LVTAIYTGLNEGPDNWQSLWTCAAYMLLAVTLWRARAHAEEVTLASK